MFREHMAEDEQLVKRYTRLLQQLASETLRGAKNEPLRKLLTEFLELIMNAMNAQAAALLLFDPDTHQLITPASAGVSDGTLEEYATALDPSSFEGCVAAEPSSILDASTTELKVNDTLMRKGIHSLLAVRLPRHHQLVGVLYVGLSGIRKFSARELRRIQVLSDRLSVHLDNARLYKDLREKIDALKRERQLRENFMALLAHDLRGPLNVAKMATSLLLDHPERFEGRRRFLVKIESNIARMDQMIGDLLDGNCISANERLPLRLDEIDVSQLARQIVEELTLLHGPRFRLEARERVRGYWSAEELRRAIWNLATNAVKYGRTTSTSRSAYSSPAQVRNYSSITVVP